MLASTHRRTLDLKAVVLCSLLLLAACAANDGEPSDAAVTDQTAVEDQEQSGISSTVTAAPATATTEVVVPPSEQTLAPLPTATDPCIEPAAHEVGVREYGFMFEGEERPVGVVVGSEAALSDSVVFVGLHGGPRTWQDIPFLVNTWGFDSMVVPKSRVVIFAPQAHSGESAFWTQSESFNVDYLTEFFSLVAGSVCLSDSKVVLLGTGQGVFAAAEGVCGADLPVDLLVLFLGMVKLTECNPSKPIPILSVDQYEFHPQVGAHWDGGWNPPGQIEMERTGGFQATPEDLAVWADLYNCTGTPTEEQLAYSGRRTIDRPTSVLAYRDCDAALVAFGMEAAEDNVWPSFAAGLNARPRLRSELRALLGEE